jgi:hypothetical protein
MQSREQLQHEILQLADKQIDSLEKETFGGLTDAELRDYEERQERIHELCDELQYLDPGA